MIEKWISCSERLPEEIGTYMTTLDYGTYGLAVGAKILSRRVLGWEDDCVIAWMPLPKPYESNKEERRDDPSHPFADDVMMGERRTDE